MGVTAVIPMRGRDCLTTGAQPRFKLAGRPLWEFTFDHSLEAGVSRIVVATDTTEFEDIVAGYHPGLTHFLRPPGLSDRGVSTVDVAAHVARELGLPETDRVLLLEISHPVRPQGLLASLVDAAQANDSDALVTVKSVHYTFWRKDNGGVKRMPGGGDEPGCQMYRELVGIGSVFKVASLLSEDAFGERADLVPMEDLSSRVDIRDETDLWLAEQVLKRMAAKDEAGV